MFGVFKGIGKIAGLAKALKPVAPVLAKGLEFAAGGPVVSAALKAISSVVGGDPEDPDSVEAALARASPDDLVKLRQEETRYEAAIRKAQIDLDAKRIEDVQHARVTNSRSPTIRLLGVAIVIGGMAIISWLIWELIKHPGEISQTANNILFTGLGALISWANSVISYFFGSSASGEEAQTRLGNGAN